jgi:hypothetical protein
MAPVMRANKRKDDEASHFSYGGATDDADATANKRVKADTDYDSADHDDGEKKQRSVGGKYNPHEFDHFLFRLLAFKADAGNYQVLKEEHPDLHNWLQCLKYEYKQFIREPESSQLTALQIKVLESLHCPLTSRGDDHWNRFFDLLNQYKEVHGHVLVPRLCEIPGLGDWVTDQRRQYKSWKQGQSSQLSKERREKLEALGFAWQVRNRPEWDSRFLQLTDYKQKIGDCKVCSLVVCILSIHYIDTDVPSIAYANMFRMTGSATLQGEQSPGQVGREAARTV